MIFIKPVFLLLMILSVYGLTVLHAQDITPSSDFRIVSGSFINYHNAEKRALELQSQGFANEIEQYDFNDKTFYRVLLKPSFKNKEKAKQEALSLSLNSYWIRPPALKGSIIAQFDPSNRAATTLVQRTTQQAVIPEELNERFKNRSDPNMGLASGKVLDASTGNPIPEVEVKFQEDEQKTYTNDSGVWYLEVTPGKKNLVLQKEGYNFTPVQLKVSKDQPTLVEEKNLVGNPKLEQGNIRFVLTWGYLPKDLDSHLITPNKEMVYFGNKNPYGAGANLDVDDVTSYGPETITITDLQEGEYIYLVHNYSGYPDLTVSDAVVQIYNEQGLLHTITIPQRGNGEWWFVGSWVNDHFVIINEISNLDL